MIKTRIGVEKEIKRLMIKLHQEVFGKGPEEVWIKVNRNVVTFLCSQSLCQIEDFLLRIPNGEIEVKRIRNNIQEFLKPRLYSDIESICGFRVEDVTVQLSIQANVMFGAILLEKTFDEQFFYDLGGEKG